MLPDQVPWGLWFREAQENTAVLPEMTTQEHFGSRRNVQNPPGASRSLATIAELLPGPAVDTMGGNCQWP